MHKIKSIIILLVVIQAINCSNETESTQTVATVGEYDITFDELDLSFKLNPMYAIRTPYRLARNSQLDFMIENKFYLITAEEVDLADDPQVQQRLQYIADQEVIKAHLRDSFYNQVVLQAEEQQTALKRWSEKRQVYFLRAPDRSTADSLRRILDTGKDLDLLAAQLQLSPPSGISGGEVGEITFGDMDAQMEAAIFELEAGKHTAVLDAPAGHFIFQVTDIRQNTDIAGMDLNSRLNYVNRILRNRKMDRLIRDHLRELSANRQIQINNRLVDLLLGAVSQATADQTQPQNPFTPHITSSDLEQVQFSIGELQNQPVARFGDTELTLDEYLQRIKGMPPLQRPNLSTRSRLMQSMIDLIRDDLLLEDAQEQDIAGRETVQKRIRENQQDYLANELRQRLGSAQFRTENPQLWQEYQKTLGQVKRSTRVQRMEANLFPDISHPDSVMAPPPIMLFMRDRYIW